VFSSPYPKAGPRACQVAGDALQPRHDRDDVPGGTRAASPLCELAWPFCASRHHPARRPGWCSQRRLPYAVMP